MQVVSFPGQLLTLHITPLDDIGDPTYGLVSLVQEGGLENDVSRHSRSIGPCTIFFISCYSQTNELALSSLLDTMNECCCCPLCSIQDLVKFVPSLQTIYPDNPHYQFRLQVNPNMQVQKVGVSVQLFSAIAVSV